MASMVHILTRINYSCTQVEIEPHPHIREACTAHEFDREHATLCQRYCAMCRCFVCTRPPSLCSDWHGHSTAVSTSVVSQQKRALALRRLKQSNELAYEETLEARAFYYDVGSSRGSIISGKYARGRVRLRLGDAVIVGHTELLFCVQPPGWAAPLRTEMASSSDDSSGEESTPNRRKSLLKDIMKGTLAGVSSKRELGVDSDAINAMDNTAGNSGAVLDKADRLRRLSSLSSKRLPESAPASTISTPNNIHRSSPPAAQQRPGSGLAFLSRAPSQRARSSFKWSSA